MTQSGTPNSQPGSLDEAAQQQLIQQIGRSILQVLPPSWQEASIEYRGLGAHSELAAQLVAPNGTVIPLGVPAEAEAMFAQLRHGMYQPERGTWISALYRIQHSGNYSVDFNGDYEPAWRAAPPTETYTDELTRYPRAEENIPSWLAERATGPAVALRIAEVFDEMTEGGPKVNRPGIEPQEREQLVEYLERAPIVLAARSFDADQLSPDRSPSVPLTFHTDGDWIWPGAVGYYLRRHAVPPEADLVSHIRDRGFTLPEIDAATREVAISTITGGSRG